MSDKNLNKVKPVAKPQELHDEQLEGAQGGYGYELTDVYVPSYDVNGASAQVAPGSKTKKFSSK